MTKMRIGDLAARADDSDSDLDQPKLLLNCNDGTAANLPPNGHVPKRRVRPKPNSSVTFGDLADSPFVVHSTSKTVKRTTGGTIAFPTLGYTRPRHVSTSSVSSADIPSPVSLFRSQAGAGTRSRTQSQSTTRRPAQRHASNSSASLFFGPSIPSPEAKSPVRSTLRPNHPTHRTQTKKGNRHTYSGNDPRVGWEATPSKSPPFNLLPNCSEEDTDIDDFFSGPSESSFAFTVIDSTPSRPRNPITFLPKKYKPRDSAILFESDDDRIPSMPGASSSLSTINSGDGLITPAYPSQTSGWPSHGGPLVAGLDNDLFCRDSDAYSRSEADAFIMRLLTGNPRPAQDKEDCTKRMPDTPVKKMKITHFVVERPWQSAFTRKIGSEEFDYLAPPPGRGGGKKTGPGKKPRKSLPAAFPTLSGGVDDESPPERKDTKYAGLGLGRPTEKSKNSKPATGHTHWLMRRSSSGMFSNISSGSDNSATATPTRPKDKDEWRLTPPRVPALQLFASKPGQLSNDQSYISSSSNSTITSPTSPRPFKSGRRPHGSSPLKQRGGIRYAQPVASGDECPGKFERDFDVLDEDLGSGEFGHVLKVRRKTSDDDDYGPGSAKDDDLYAVKKSKPIEGVKHRLRLREEVDILKHLTDASEEGRGHPNVLRYIDSWEQDGLLFIQTELCALGSFGKFLWDYGRKFPRLDEARVWKVLAELTEGITFIHDNGILHLDLKPANIFVTTEGRLRIGDFGMATVWPRLTGGGFEREGDREYMAPEVLQGKYSKAADIFGLGMTILETAANIVVPGQGEAWHNLRQDNFEQVELGDCPELLELIKSMMRSNPMNRFDAHRIRSHAVVSRVRDAMEKARYADGPAFGGSPLASVPDSFLATVLARDYDEPMDLSL